MTDVLIVRHGQSEWNALGRWQGQADPPLSPLGEQQAAHAAPRLSGIDAIVASDLQRAERTARIIAEALGLDVRIDPDLRERHAGEWQGLTKDDIEAQWPGWLAERRRPPGFESDESVGARTDVAIRRVLTDHPGQRVLLVSHGGVIYRREQLLGGTGDRIPNLGGRWFHHRATDDSDRDVASVLDDLVLGDRVVFVGEDEVTVPTQL